MYGTRKIIILDYFIAVCVFVDLVKPVENGPSEAGADEEVDESQQRKFSPSEHGSTAEAQAAEHEAEVTGVRSTATDTGMIEHHISDHFSRATSL